jgi:hypothetical protein
MFALLMWLYSKPEFRTITMANLMFFLKSPHIHERKKYIFVVERILRENGYSLFETQQTADTEELAACFNIVHKRVAQVSDPSQLERAGLRNSYNVV